MLRYFYCIILPFLCLIFLCTDLKGETILYRDLIDDFTLADKHHVTAEIDLTGNIDSCLGHGWSNREKNFRWAVGLESELTFFSKGESNIKMRITCRPISPREKACQTIDVYLNGVFIQKINLQKRMAKYTVPLPEKSLRKGENYLKFRYRYARRPFDYSDSNDRRNLSVAFKKIAFAPRSPATALSKEGHCVSQSTGTFLDYYYFIPQHSTLEAVISSIDHGLSAIIDIDADDCPPNRLRTGKSRSVKIALNQYAGKHVRFRFYVENTIAPENTAKQSIIVWSKITLSRPPAETKTAKPKALKNARNLDIVYIVLDAFNSRHAGLYGYHRKTTPFLNRLAGKGIVFDNFFANHPYTLASTATLMTSRYAHDHGLIKKNRKLNAALPTLPEILAENGLVSFLITRHGFISKAWDLSRGFTRVFKNKIEEAASANIDDLARIYESEYRDRQKFIYLHFIPPHAPYTPPDKYNVFIKNRPPALYASAQNLRKIKNRKIRPTKEIMASVTAQYDANILYADSLVKQVYDLLKNYGVLNKTILVITSDHGEAFLEHGELLHCTTVYDEMIHIPLIITFPESIDPGNRHIKEIGDITDITPTILDIFDIHSKHDFEGLSLLSRINGINSKKHIYAETLLTDKKCIRTLKYKYINTRELYDIENDPAETENLFEKLPVTAGYFTQQFKHYRVKTPPPENKATIDLRKVDPEIINNLKTLGYIE